MGNLTCSTPVVGRPSPSYHAEQSPGNCNMDAGARRRWVALYVLLQVCAAHPRSMVTIANEMMHEEDIDADEYLWETLPGRCCFQEMADDCDTCSVWSDPENYCHKS